MKEYRKIPSLKFLYEISNDGVLRNVKSKKIRKPFINIKKGRNTGYKLYTIDNVSLGQKKVQEHRLVAEVWCKDFTPECIINHLDGNGLNNHYTNLECGTLASNARHANDNGLFNSRRVYTIHDEVELEFYSCQKAAEWVQQELGYKGKLVTISNNIVKYILSNKKGLMYKHKWYRKETLENKQK